jgi:hypothetical protein
MTERVAELRRAQQPEHPHPAPPVPTDIVPSLPDPGASTASPPPRGPLDTEAPPGFGDTRPRPHPGVYVLGGVAVGAVVGGILLNLGARGKMDECRRLARDGQTQAATDACDAARPRAYTSYALFAAAGAAAVADAVWLLISTRPPENRLTLVPLSDGASLMARVRF